MTHHEKNSFAVMMTIYAHKTDGREREVIKYVCIKEFASFGAGVEGGFQNIKELHVIK